MDRAAKAIKSSFTIILLAPSFCLAPNFRILSINASLNAIVLSPDNLSDPIFIIWITDIYLHLDNGEPGRIAAKNIKELLQDRYHVHDQPPPSGKDFNDYLRTLKTTPRPPNPIRRYLYSNEFY